MGIQLFILALRNLGSTRTGALFGIAPFIGSAFSILFLRETPQALFWAAIPLMVFGAYLMLSENHKHRHVHDALEQAHAHIHTDGHHAHQHSETDDAGDERHSHNHVHEDTSHSHPHAPDLHHRHAHQESKVS